MRVLTDLHTHSVASTHGYSTVQEMAAQAAIMGLELFALTDHGPTLPDAPHPWHFETMKRIPREINGVTVIRGVEANVVNENGELDFLCDRKNAIELVIASSHTSTFLPQSVEQYSKMWHGVIRNPDVDILGHMVYGEYIGDFDSIMKSAKEYNKAVELNNSYAVSLYEETREIAKKCMEIGTLVSVDSDAHISFEIGKYDAVYKILDEIGFPEELVMNLNRERVLKYLCGKKGLVI